MEASKSLYELYRIANTVMAPSEARNALGVAISNVIMDIQEQGREVTPKAIDEELADTQLISLKWPKKPTSP